MPTIRTSSGKGAALTPTEADTNMKRNVKAQAGNYTILSADNRATVEYIGAGGHTFTLPDVSTLLASEETGDFLVIIKHGGTGLLTVAMDTGDTIDGNSANLTLRHKECYGLKAGSVVDDWMITTKYQLHSTGTVTFTNVASNSSPAAQEVTHGVGTDDIDFGFMLLDDEINSVYWNSTSAAMMNSDGYIVSHTPDQVIIPANMQNSNKPAAGSLRFNIFVALATASGINTIRMKWWARARS